MRRRWLTGTLPILVLLGCTAVPEPRIEEPSTALPAEDAAPPPAGSNVPQAPQAEQAEPSLGQPAVPDSAEASPLPEPAQEGGETAEVYAGGPRPVPGLRQAAVPLPLPQAAAPAKPPAAKKAPPPAARPLAAPTQGTPAPATAPPASENKPAPEPSRELLARKGDSVIIELEGRGWLFLGLPDKVRGISLAGTETDARRTRFTFKTQEYGEYDLRFQLQDNSRGVLRGEAARVRVLAEAQFQEQLGKAQAAAAAGAQAAAAPADPVRLQKAEKLFGAGAYELALPEYLGLYREADPLLNDRLAAIYAAKGELSAAEKYFEKNLEAPAPYAERAVQGLVRAALDQEDRERVLAQVPALLALRSADTGRELLAAARFLTAQGAHPAALELLTAFLGRYPGGPRLDQALFLLARLFELESPLRDVRKARDYYEKVYKDFPESEYAAEAHTRILYLDRYFFHVQ